MVAVSRMFFNVAESLNCSSNNMKYINSKDRTNVHSMFVNAVKNHGQVLNLLKPWSRTLYAGTGLDNV